jgi:hypothetical protein
MSEQTSETRTSKNAKPKDTNSSPHAAHEGEASFMPPLEDAADDHFGEAKNDDIVAKVATIAVVGVGAALISTELIPGMLIGVAAALLPGIGPKMRPFLKSTVKASYNAVRKTREMIAEAGEQMQDMIAEAKAEEVPPVAPPNGTKPHA